MASPPTPPVLISPGLGDRFRRKPIYVPLKNVPGKLAMIHKSKLHIDSRYQRNINERLVTRIMANWSWVSCGVISVSQRPGANSYFIIDGQHRWKAATVLSNITDLPCLIFALDTVKDEATGFLATNTERRIPTLRDQFKALLITGDPAAKALDAIAAQYDRRVSAPSSPSTISCVSDCMRLLRENKAAFERVFPVIADLCEGHAITGRLLRGMCYIERHMPPKESLSDDRWHSRITHVGEANITLSIKQAAMFENRGDDQTCALGILKAINRNLRLPLILTQNGR